MKTFEELILALEKEGIVYQTYTSDSKGKDILSLESMRIYIHKREDGFEISFNDEYSFIENLVNDLQPIFNILKEMHKMENNDNN